MQFGRNCTEVGCIQCSLVDLHLGRMRSVQFGRFALGKDAFSAIWWELYLGRMQSMQFGRNCTEVGCIQCNLVGFALG